jgi:hypothetical protein
MTVQMFGGHHPDPRIVPAGVPGVLHPPEMSRESGAARDESPLRGF